MLYLRAAVSDEMDEVVFFALLVFVFFVVFGALAVTDDVIADWGTEHRS